MFQYRVLLCFCAVLCINPLFAKLADAKQAILNLTEPSDQNVQVDEIDPNATGYFPYDICTDISNGSGTFAPGTFEIKKIEDKLNYYWQSKDEVAKKEMCGLLAIIIMLYGIQ